MRSAAVDTINSLIDYLASTRIVQGMGIRLQQYAHGTVISTTAASVSSASVNGVSSYNGYFTLKDVSTYNEDGTVHEFRIAVCDGETWDANNESSGNMPVYVNSECYYLDSIIFDDIADSSSWDIFIQFTPLPDGEDPAQHKFVELKIAPESVSSNTYLIGEVSLSNGKVRVIQRHTAGIGNGIPRIWSYTINCTMEIDTSEK